MVYIQCAFICIEGLGKEIYRNLPEVCKIFLKCTQKIDNTHCFEEEYLRM